MSILPTSQPLKPVGGKRSSKRERILNVFLRQEGHLSADDLFDLIKQDDQHISRATVYRALQWMVEAGIAQKVDFGEGRSRFERTYRHPRHYHLICKNCNSSSEFLSSDIEMLIEEVSTSRNFDVSRSVVQVYGTCEKCSTGKSAPGDEGHTELLFARDALQIAIATERSGLEFYSRAARLAHDQRGRKVFQDLADEEKKHLATLEKSYEELLARDPHLEDRPRFLFFKGAASGLFATGADELVQGVDDQQALLIGIRCERGSHNFFKKYAEKFEDSEGKQIFADFAAEEKEHLELLLKEYRELVKRQSQPAKRVASRTRKA